MSEVLVFYAGQLCWEGTLKEINSYRVTCGQEIYNGAHVYYSKMMIDRHWYRMDGTPSLIEDVPKALRSWVLVLS